MDESTAELILQLMQEDVGDALEGLKGKQRAGQATDNEVALRMWESQLEQSSTMLADYKIARSIARAVRDDAVALTIAAQEEVRVLEDRRMALRLGGHNENDDETVRDQQARLHPVDSGRMEEQNMAAALAQLTLREHTDSGMILYFAGESSKSEMANEQPQLECAACMETNLLADMVEAPCTEHYYCKRCVIRLFEESVTDETLFPPRCCRTEIPLSTVRDTLGFELAKCFLEKSIEHSDTSRTYCANPTCSQYIPPDHVRLSVGTCKICSTRTCTLCKKREHPGVCEDEEDQVLELARTEGWQRCAGCRTLVELQTGCNHITYVFLFLVTRTGKKELTAVS
jgi:hypothetical protein